LPLCCFAPGFFFVRRLRWSPMEKLCGAVGLSLVLLYLAVFGAYCFLPGLEGPAYAAVAVACAGLGVLGARDARQLFASAPVRRTTLGFLFLIGWNLLLLATIRNYSGGAWYGDWLEHFQRSLFFLHHYPAATPIFPSYILPARPPMMNVLAAFFMGLTQDRFEIFQVVFGFLNLMMFLSCCLMAAAIAGPRKARILPLVALFVLSPVVTVETTYTWTKGLAAFYVLLALWFYLAGWRKKDTVRMTVGFLALSAGVLVHYSAGPYCVFLALHYLVCVFRSRPRKWREAIICTAVCLPFLLTWFAWSVRTYGARGTFASNTSVTSTQGYEGGNLGKIAANFADTFVPLLVRDPSLSHLLDQPSRPGFIRDVAFLFYQPNLIFGMGLVGGPVVFWLLYRVFRRSRRRGPEWRFWLAMVPFCVLLGIASVGERDTAGSAHLTLLALEVLGLTLLACSLPLRRAVAVAVLAGCAIDFSLGVFLQAHIEHLDNSPGRTVFTGLKRVGSTVQLGAPGPYSLSNSAEQNWYRKHQYALAREWRRELGPYIGEDPLARQLAGALEIAAKDDNSYWHGWFARNGGSTVFLGDDLAGLSVGGVDLPLLALALLGLASLWAIWKEASRPLPVTAPAPPPKRAPPPARAAPPRRKAARSRR
jgi:hypothetical protein